MARVQMITEQMAFLAASQGLLSLDLIQIVFIVSHGNKMLRLTLSQPSSAHVTSRSLIPQRLPCTEHMLDALHCAFVTEQAHKFRQF